MYEELSHSTNELSLQGYVELLRRRKAILIETFVVVVMIGLIVTFLVKPTYRTGARILVEGRALAMAQYNTGDPLSNLFMPDVGHDIGTQIEVLQGENVLADAFHAAGVSPEDVDLDIKQVGTTDVIEIVAESTNPQAAERITKQLPITYLNYITGNRKVEIVNALVFARNRLREEQDKLKQTELSLQRFKESTRTASVGTERDQHIAEATAAESQVRQDEADVAAARARLDALVAARAAQPPFIESPTTSTNPQVEVVRNQLADLETSRERLLVTFKPGHLEVRKLDAQIADLKRRLATMPGTNTTVSKVRNPDLGAYEAKVADERAALQAAEARLTRTQIRLTLAQGALGKYSGLERREAELQRELERTQNNVNQLSKSVLDLSLREQAYHDPVRTITPAGIARQVAPKKLNNLAYSVVVGLILGLCLALLQDFLDDRINSADDARRIVGVPALGYVPLIERTRTPLLSQLGSNSSLLESYRVLRSNVQFATVDTPVKALVITSAYPGEGKSVTACNLAVAMALDGRRVILVDADLRRPTVHEKLNVQRHTGLTDVLLGNARLDGALQETSIGGLRVLSTGPLPPNPAELLNSGAMRSLLAALKERADLVIFDTPPCLATADAPVLAAASDGVLFVVHLGATGKTGVRHATELLRQAHTRILGVVFNKIDSSGARDDYFYGYYAYYGTRDAGEDDSDGLGMSRQPVKLASVATGYHGEERETSNDNGRLEN